MRTEKQHRNRFADLMEATADPVAKSPDVPPVEIAEVQPSHLPDVGISESSDGQPSAVSDTRKSKNLDVQAAARPEGARMGRPPGKKSHPDFIQMTAYVPLELHEDVKEELLRINRQRRRRRESTLEISGVVEEQLRTWVKAQKSK